MQYPAITPRRQCKVRSIMEGEENHRKKRRHSRVQCVEHFHQSLEEIETCNWLSFRVSFEADQHSSRSSL